MRYPLVALGLLALAPAACLAGGRVAVDAQPGVVVRFDPGTSSAERASALRSVHAVDQDALTGVPRTHVVTLPGGASASAAVRSLAANPDVTWAEVDRPVQAVRTPDDPLFGGLWGMTEIGAPTAWDTITGSANVTVGVVDTGIAANHPDLAANVRTDLSRNFVEQGGVADPTAWTDTNGHGTHVAGTIGAVGNNGIGVAGVSWASGIAAARVLGLDGHGPTSTVADGLAWAGARTRVVNASLSGSPSAAEKAAIAANPNTLYVVAAGNTGTDNDVTPRYPCAIDLPNVICVAALDQTNSLATFSNYGATSVDLGAPGVDINSSMVSLTTIADDTSAMGTWVQDPNPSWQADVTSTSVPDIITHGVLTGTAGDPAGALAVLTRGTPLPLLNGTACRLNYGVAMDLPDVVGRRDTYVVQAKAPAGAWQTVDGPWTGSTDGLFDSSVVDLSTFDHATGLQLRVVVSSTGAGGSYGIAPSDPYLALAHIVVRCITPQPAAGVYRSEGGTSMASPHVAGAAALLLSARPDLSVAQLKRAILSTVTPTPSLAGRTVTGGRLNVAAALAMATAPDPAPESAPAPAAAARTPMALTLHGAQPVKLTTSRWKVKVPLECTGTAERSCTMTVSLRYGTNVVGSLKVRIPAGWRGTKAVALNATGKRVLTNRSPIRATVRTVPRDAATGIVRVGRVRITRG